MRKLISLLLACVMVLGLFAACGNTAPAETTAAPTEAAPETEAPTEAVVPASDIVILYTKRSYRRGARLPQSPQPR